ncbi:MAG: YheC/YheD family protein [Halanaerobiales bacterium]
MWIKINIIESEKKCIFFPHPFKIKKEEINIIFGGSKVKSIIKKYDNYEPQSLITREKPLRIKITSGLQKKLLIPASQLYQFKISNNNLYIGPVIAFLMGNYKYKAEYMKRYNERLGLYPQVGGLIYTFSPEKVNFENKTISGYYYQNNNQWKPEETLPFPSFIIRRNFSTNPSVIKKLQEYTDNNLYNSCRLSKLELYNILKKKEEFKSFIPPTISINKINPALKFINKYQKTILKPISSSRGRGIFVIEKKNDNSYTIYPYFNNKSQTINIEELKTTINNITSDRNYLIQKYLDLKTINSSLFDIRVVMQKISSENWKCTGVEVRKAGKKQKLTNLSRGGTALTFSRALKSITSSSKKSIKLRNRILELAFKFCNIMEHTDENYYEFGLDIAYDQKDKLWFLEANFLPAFNGFKELNYGDYLFILYNSLRYAVSKTNFVVDNFLISSNYTFL